MSWCAILDHRKAIGLAGRRSPTKGDEQPITLLTREAVPREGLGVERSYSGCTITGPLRRPRRLVASLAAETPSTMDEGPCRGARPQGCCSTPYRGRPDPNQGTTALSLGTPKILTSISRPRGRIASEVEGQPLVPQDIRFPRAAPIKRGKGTSVVATTRPETMLGDHPPLRDIPAIPSLKHLKSRQSTPPARWYGGAFRSWPDEFFPTPRKRGPSGVVKITARRTTFNDFDVGRLHKSSRRSCDLPTISRGSERKAPGEVSRPDRFWEVVPKPDP